MDPYKLFDAEYKFAKIIWENEPVKSTELVKLCSYLRKLKFEVTLYGPI